jgi:uncharacterized integral membrane protein
MGLLLVGFAAFVMGVMVGEIIAMRREQRHQDELRRIRREGL